MRRSIFVVALAAGLASTSCGGLGGASGGGGPSPAIAHPTGASDLVLRWEYRGGFVPFEYSLTRLPSFSLFGDGTAVTEGPQVEIYPGPAVPNLLATRITEDGVQAILRAARDAGLMSGDATYDFRCIADAPTTVFTVNAGGSSSTVAASALSEGQGECPGADAQARSMLAAFQAKLGDLRRWLPDGSIGPEEPFEPAAIRLYVGRYAGQADLPQEAITWPLAPPLDAFGTPLTGQAAGLQLRCGVVAGDELPTLLPDLASANQLTPWRSDGAEYRLLVRPLLPDEHGC